MKPILLLVALILSGCTASEVRQYDPNEITVRGRVIKKVPAEQQDVSEELKRIRTAELMSVIAANSATLGFGYVVIPIGFSTEVPGKPTQYEVTLINEENIRLYSGYSGFEEGDCVTVFLSEDWERFPPRMAYSEEDCKE